MRIIHCADIHLDSKMNANLDPVRSRERRAELVLSFKHLVEYANQNNIDAIIIAGDLFDTGTISNATVGVVEHCIRKYSDIDFYYLRGNHDERDVLEGLKLPNLKVFGKEWTSYEMDKESRVVITGAINPSSDIELNPSALNIVVLHGQIYESATTQDINLSFLRHKSIDYLALGHVHKYTAGELDARGTYCYPGCLESRGFDECSEHGIVVLDIDSHRNINKNFVKWGSRQSYRLSVDVSDCFNSYEALNRIEHTIDTNRVTEEDMVEIILTGDMSELAQISIDMLEGELKNRFYCMKIKDNTGISINLEEYTKEISLKSEFIKIVLADDSLDENTKNEIIKTGLLALAGEI